MLREDVKNQKNSKLISFLTKRKKSTIERSNDMHKRRLW